MDGTFGKGCHLHLIDGSAFIFRAYHALPPLTRRSDGMPVGAVAGFCNMLWRYLEESKGADAPTHAAVIFDHSSKTFRNAIYDQYKANRPEPPDDLKPQFPLTRDATRAFNVACLEVEDYEADDIIATLACQARARGGRATIISSDKDLMQLVGDGVTMHDPIKNAPIGRDEVIAKFGVPPEKVADVQALAGDSTDNVPGAPGIGIKTAALLIEEYGDLETLLARASEIKQPKRRESLVNNAELIRISKRLVTLTCDMPVGVDLDTLAVRDPDPAVLLAFLAEMGFRTLAGRVADHTGAKAPAMAGKPEGPAKAPAEAAPAPELPPLDPASAEVLGTEDALAAWIAEATAQGRVAIAARMSGPDELQADWIGLGLCLAPGRSAYLPLRHVEGEGLMARPAPGQLDPDRAEALLRPLLEDPATLKIGHDIKREVKLLARHGITLAPVADAQLANYVLNAGRNYHALDELSETFLGHRRAPLKELLGVGAKAIPFAQLPPAKGAPPSAEEAELALRLWDHLAPQLPPNAVTRVYETLERPLVPVLAALEAHGLAIDRARLARMSSDFAQKLAGIEAEIFRLAGTEFTVGSPKQLGEVLFDRLGLAGGRKSGKTGALSTGADVLEDLAEQGHEIAERVLDWRLLNKLKTTYTDSLQAYINPETGRVHTSYMIAGSNTGRLASTEPNLQNIPIRTPEGREIREAFVAGPGMRIVSLDYSQIELRLLAHMADILALKRAYREGIDIHALTASEMFGVPIEGMDKHVRARAKAINFGVIYGISAFGLARNLRIPREEAAEFIKRYFERFPEIRDYMDRTISEAKAQGFVTTLFGRKSNIAGINLKGPAEAAARRQAINAPIQGTAADIIRRAMIRMPDAIAHLPAKMLLSVHDELVFEAEEGAVDALIAAATPVMERAHEPAVQLSVPLVVEGGSGATWGAAH